MKKYIPILIRNKFVLSLMLLLSYTSAYASHVVVVSRTDSDIQELSRSQVRQIFMGGTLSRKYKPAVFSVGTDARTTFNTQIIGLTEHRVQAYWSQLLFTGRAKPPAEFSEANDVIDYLLKEPNSVGYLPGELPLPKGLMVVYEK